MIPRTYCGLSGLTKMTVELNLDPLMESRSAPMLILEVFLLLFLGIEIISNKRVYKLVLIRLLWFKTVIWTRARGTDLIPLRSATPDLKGRIRKLWFRKYFDPWLKLLPLLCICFLVKSIIIFQSLLNCNLSEAYCLSFWFFSFWGHDKTTIMLGTIDISQST